MVQLREKIWYCVSKFKKCIFRTLDSLKEKIFEFENQETEAWIHITRQKRFPFSGIPTYPGLVPGWLFFSHLLSYHHILVDCFFLIYSHTIISWLIISLSHTLIHSLCFMSNAMVQLVFLICYELLINCLFHKTEWVYHHILVNYFSLTYSHTIISWLIISL